MSFSCLKLIGGFLSQLEFPVLLIGYMASEDLAAVNFPILSYTSLLTLTTLASFLFLKKEKLFLTSSSLCFLIPLPGVYFSQLFMWLAFLSSLKSQEKHHVFREVFPENYFQSSYPSPQHTTLFIHIK